MATATKTTDYVIGKQKMRWCRAVFHGPRNWPSSTQHDVKIEFGYFGTEQKLESVRMLREQYADYAFVRCHSIESPPPYKPRGV